MVPVILVTGWHAALHLMTAGYWSVRHAPGVFHSTPVAPRGPVFGVSRAGMAYLVRHSYECTHAARTWLCAPNQIG
jgi:hypothetical protein